MDPADPDNEQNVDGGPGTGPDPTTYDAIRMVGAAADGGMTEKVFVSYVDGETEYYDIDSDPYEMTNIVGTLAPATVTKYQGVVSAIKACKGTATCWAAQHM
jgi:hypothetical protein